MSNHEIKLKHLYLHKTDNHTTTHGCDKKGGGRWGDGGWDDDDKFIFDNGLLFIPTTVNCGLVSPNVVEDGAGSVEG
jgi:hypothetical protein